MRAVNVTDNDEPRRVNARSDMVEAKLQASQTDIPGESPCRRMWALKETLLPMFRKSIIEQAEPSLENSRMLQLLPNCPIRSTDTADPDLQKERTLTDEPISMIF
jgi:hypothetical protein